MITGVCARACFLSFYYGRSILRFSSPLSSYPSIMSPVAMALWQCHRMAKAHVFFFFYQYIGVVSCSSVEKWNKWNLLSVRQTKLVELCTFYWPKRDELSRFVTSTPADDETKSTDINKFALICSKQLTKKKNLYNFPCSLYYHDFSGVQPNGKVLTYQFASIRSTQLIIYFIVFFFCCSSECWSLLTMNLRSGKQLWREILLIVYYFSVFFFLFFLDVDV